MRGEVRDGERGEGEGPGEGILFLTPFLFLFRQ